MLELCSQYNSLQQAKAQQEWGSLCLHHPTGCSVHSVPHIHYLCLWLHLRHFAESLLRGSVITKLSSHWLTLANSWSHWCMMVCLIKQFCYVQTNWQPAFWSTNQTNSLIVEYGCMRSTKITFWALLVWLKFPVQQNLKKKKKKSTICPVTWTFQSKFPVLHMRLCPLLFLYILVFTVCTVSMYMLPIWRVSVSEQHITHRATHISLLTQKPVHLKILCV